MIKVKCITSKKKKTATSGVRVAAEGSGSSQFRVIRVTIPWKNWHDSHPNSPDEAKARQLFEDDDFFPNFPFGGICIRSRKTYHPGICYISHRNGKLGKKSSSNMPFLGGYVNSLEGITLITLGEKQKKQHPLRSLYQAISPQPFFAQDKSWWSFCPIHDNAVGSSPPTHLKNMHKSNFIHLPTKTKVKIQNILRKSPAKKWRENLRLTASGNHVFFVPHELPNFQEIDVSLRVVV